MEAAPARKAVPTRNLHDASLQWHSLPVHMQATHHDEDAWAR